MVLTPGRSSHTMAIEAANILLYTREMLCQLFNVQDPFRNDIYI